MGILVHQTYGFPLTVVGLQLVGFIKHIKAQPLLPLRKTPPNSPLTMDQEESKVLFPMILSPFLELQSKMLISVKPLHYLELPSLLENLTVFWVWLSHLSQFW